MLFRINGRWPDGTWDSFNVTGESLEEVQGVARENVARRNWTEVWSEELIGDEE